MHAYGSLYIFFVSINDITSRGSDYKVQFGDLVCIVRRPDEGNPMEPGLQNILRDRLNLVIRPRTSEMPPRLDCGNRGWEAGT